MDSTVVSGSGHTYYGTTISDQAHAHLGDTHNHFSDGMHDEKCKKVITERHLSSRSWEGVSRIYQELD